ncbi:unnamed protein product [Arctogadus glacialis]
MILRLASNKGGSPCKAWGWSQQSPLNYPSLLLAFCHNIVLHRCRLCVLTSMCSYFIWNGPPTDGTSSSDRDISFEERFDPTTTFSCLRAYSKAEFEALYEEQYHLGRGGYGSVWAGIRKQDNLSVAMKHIVVREGNGLLTPDHWTLEISLMLKVKGEPGSASPGAAVQLLDWFKLDQELILVQERPVPSTDLLHYVKTKWDRLEEQEAKMIMQKVIKAITDIHSKGVLHRDIKPENILIETGYNVPRVWIIDFGCGYFLHHNVYDNFSGTSRYYPPEWFEHQSYRAEPMTVWQIGLLAYQMLVGEYPFDTEQELISKEPRIGSELSPNCQEFVRSCLAKQPQERLPLDSLLAHPWLQ